MKKLFLSLVLLLLALTVLGVSAAAADLPLINDEAELLNAADDVDKVYMEQVLPQKMKWNLKTIKHYSFFGDIATMFRTVFAVLGKENN